MGAYALNILKESQAKTLKYCRSQQNYGPQGTKRVTFLRQFTLSMETCLLQKILTIEIRISGDKDIVKSKQTGRTFFFVSLTGLLDFQSFTRKNPSEQGQILCLRIWIPTSTFEKLDSQPRTESRKNRFSTNTSTMIINFYIQNNPNKSHRLHL